MTCGIYQISGPGKVYIGQSNNVSWRLETHFEQLRKNKHHCRHLQNAYNKHGAKKFVGLQIETCSNDQLTNRENFYMIIHKGRLYNSKIFKGRIKVC